MSPAEKVNPVVSKTQIAGARADAATLVTINDANAGQRIDNFLAAKLKGVPKSHIFRILRSGEVRVNKGRIAASYKLVDGDVIRVPPIRTSTPSADQLDEAKTAERRAKT